MDSALAVVEKAKALGVTITPAADKIRLEPGSKVPPELMQAIREHKDEILAILTSKRSASCPVSPRAAEIERVMRWAGFDPGPWKRLHEAMMRDYAPSWEHIDARDTLVAWTASWEALSKARRDLTKLKAIRPPLTVSERNSRLGRQADVSFWGSLASRLEASAAAALREDAKAAKILAALLDEREVKEESNDS